MASTFSRFRTMYWRQFMLTAGMVLLSLSLISVAFFSLSYNYTLREKKDELQSKTELVSRLAARFMVDGQLSQDQSFQVLTNFASTMSNMDLFIYDPAGNTLLTSSDNFEEMEGQQIYLPAALTQQVLNGYTYSGTDTLGGIYSEPVFLVASPIRDLSSGEISGMVIAATGSHMLTEMWRSFMGLFWVIAITVLMLTFILVSFTTMQQTRPIQEMAKATKRFAQGNFDARINDYGHCDEIAELAASFNSMADSLQETERQRREFIANISHELKTPMTTIAGYTDGILDGTIPPEKERQYLQIISDESRRLSRLVRRMLSISQLQAKDVMHSYAPVDIGESMRQVLISLERRITDRQLDVHVEIPDNAILVLGDKDLITQVIYNLLENASKFATPGSTLFLGLQRSEQSAQVTVQNCGETIPPQELPLLFERFHKSDKSRSEDKDGVGLGLYIVKTILEQHHEKIHVESENGITTFSFSLPLAE